MSPRRPPTALTIAGTDSAGGAGVAADLKTFEALGVWGLLAVTAVTAQDTLGVHGWEPVDPGLVSEQVRAVAVDIGVDAAKTGMLPNASTVREVAKVVEELELVPLVVDPVLEASTGAPLVDGDTVEALRTELLPLATLVTPNLWEAKVLAGMDEVSDRAAMAEAARRILAFGPEGVLVTGGHLPGGPALDCLARRGGVRWLEGERVASTDTHGTGCVLSAAATARLARGDPLFAAVEQAKTFVQEAIRRGVPLGSGAGSVDPGARRARLSAW